MCERGAWCLNWHFKTYKHFNTFSRRGLQWVGFPASWSIYHPWHHQCAVWRRTKMERFTSSKHAPSCQFTLIRLEWLMRIRKGVGEEKFIQCNNIICLRGEKEETKAINLRWMFVLTGSGVVGTVLMISLVICWTPAKTGSQSSRKIAVPTAFSYQWAKNPFVSVMSDSFLLCWTLLWYLELSVPLIILALMMCQVCWHHIHDPCALCGLFLCMPKSVYTLQCLDVWYDTAVLL